VIRELISWPISMARAAIELPRTMERNIREANDLMEVSREQLEVMRRQADQALEQAERMNELLARVVRLTEPLERAQRGGEFVAAELKKAIFGAERATIEAEVAVEEAKETRGGASAPPVSRGEAEEARGETEPDSER
jgi:multidrug resistance efflux pump